MRRQSLLQVHRRCSAYTTGVGAFAIARIEARHYDGVGTDENATPEKQPGEAGEGLAAVVPEMRDARKSCHSALMRVAWVVAPEGPQCSPLGPYPSMIDDVLL